MGGETEMYVNFNQDFQEYFSGRMLRNCMKDKKKVSSDYRGGGIVLAILGVMFVIPSMIMLPGLIWLLIIGLALLSFGVFFIVKAFNVKDCSELCQPNNCLNEVILISVLPTNRARSLNTLHNMRSDGVVGGIVADSIRGMIDPPIESQPGYDRNQDRFRIYAFTRAVSNPVLVGFEPDAQRGDCLANDFLRWCPNAHIGDIENKQERKTIKETKKQIGIKWDYNKVTF